MGVKEGVSSLADPGAGEREVQEEGSVTGDPAVTQNPMFGDLSRYVLHFRLLTYILYTLYS